MIRPARDTSGPPAHTRFAARVLSAALLAACAVPAAAEPHPFSAEDLVTMARLSEAQVSPDGTRVAYVLRSTDLEADKGLTDLWLVAVDGASPPRRLTTDPASETSPRFSPDGRGLYFLSTRSGSSQVWRLPLDGGEAEPVTELPLDVANLVVAPDGRHLAFSLEVFPDCADLACSAKDPESEFPGSSGRLYERLFIRQWDTWKDGRRSHLFALSLDDAGRRTGDPIDLTAALDADVPSKPFGGVEEIAFTPDGTGVVFAARVAGAGEAWSTNFDLYVAPLDGQAEPEKLTANPAWDTYPVFSPDGATLAYLAMERAGFEADRFRIVLRGWPDGGERVLAADWDRSAGELIFAPDGKTLYVTAQDTGEVRLFAVDAASGAVRTVVEGGHVRFPAVAGDSLIYGRDDLRSPVDLFARPVAARPASGGQERRLTEVNRERLAAVRTGEAEQFSFPGAGGDTVHGYLVKPVDFDPAKTYPVAFLIHGGPQGSFGNDFHYRWNPQVYAGAGYAALMIDFHGSTGYGQAFTDSITGDWGGKPLEDLKQGLAFALARYPWLDGGRACALGASYGGYMINWIAGNWPDAFRCLVNHDGLFDLRSMYYSTEELWFPEWEMGGTPWENPPGFARHNPALHVGRWQTPMLVVHGAKDFRVVESQGFATFTALQRRSIPSQLLYFPDENHFVLRPSNSLQWHRTVLAWLERWTQPE